MPILGAESDLYPANMFDDGFVGGERLWWALQTASRREKELMRRLRSLELAHYGPLISRCYCSPSGRRRNSFVPLFPGYVFLFADASERRLALGTKCVVRDIAVPQAAEFYDDLRRVRRLIQSGLEVSAQPGDPPGVRVRVRTGPLAGYEGESLEQSGEHHLLIPVRFLNCRASVKVSSEHVERVD